MCCARCFCVQDEADIRLLSQNDLNQTVMPTATMLGTKLDAPAKAAHPPTSARIRLPMKKLPPKQLLHQPHPRVSLTPCPGWAAAGGPWAAAGWPLIA